MTLKGFLWGFVPLTASIHQRMFPLLRLYPPALPAPPHFCPQNHCSKRITFGRYLCKIMCSWALVCDVWFLEPLVNALLIRRRCLTGMGRGMEEHGGSVPGGGAGVSPASSVAPFLRLPFTLIFTPYRSYVRVRDRRSLRCGSNG